jgi:phosphohistidine phosphatase
MKFVTLLRHAKSARPPDTDDFDRPLEERGRGDSKAMGAFMTTRGVAPDVVLCSSAKRARETLSFVLPALSEPKVFYEDGLYEASPRRLLDRIRTLPDAFGHALLVGHNPAIAALAADLMHRKQSEKRLVKRLDEKFPTAALAEFEFDVRRWSDVESGEGRLVLFESPKTIG